MNGRKTKKNKSTENNNNGKRQAGSVKRTVLTILNIILLLIFTVNSAAETLLYALSDGVEILNSNLTEMYDYIERNKRLENLYSQVCRNAYTANLRITAVSVADKEITADILNSWKERYESTQTLYYLREDGSLLSWDNAAKFDLTEEQLNLLLRRKKLTSEDGSRYYLAEPCGSGTLILRIRTEGYSDFVSDMNYYTVCTVLSFDAETGAPVEDLIGNSFDRMYTREEFRWIGSRTVPELSNRGIVLLVTPDGSSGLRSLYFGITDTRTYNGREVYTCCCKPVTDLFGSSLSRVAAQLFLIVLFAVLMNRNAAGFWKEWRAGRMRGKKCSVLRIFSADSLFLSRTAFTGAVLLATFLLLAGSLETVSTYVNVSRQTDAVMDAVPEALADRNSAVIKIEDLYRENTLKTARNCVDLLNLGNGDTDQLSILLENIAEILKADEISVYDKDGKITATTSGYTGYQLSQNETDTESMLWSVINGADRELFIPISTEPDTYYCAVRRTDDIGLICMKISYHSVQYIISKLDFADTFRNVGFVGAERMYVDRNSPKTLYVLPQESSTAKELDSGCVPALSSGDVFCGTRLVDGEMCFINGQGIEDYILYCSCGISTMRERILSIFASLAQVYAAVFLLGLLGNCICLKKTFEREEEALPECPESVPSGKKKLTQNRCIVTGIMALMIAVSAISILDYIVSDNVSILYFLFQGNWEKGINIFSGFTILYSLILVIQGIRFISWFFSRLAKEANPRGVTVLQLLRSVAVASSVIWVILFDLQKLGVDTKTIVAGIGISGLALGIGAKDTITDLIAGFFLIVSGNVLVGDYIEADGFYGEVREMGIRCTRLQNGARIKTVHNSSLSKVLSYSNTEKSRIRFSVAAGTDIDGLMQLINASAERFRSAAPGMLKTDPVFGGVEIIGHIRISCFMLIETDQKDKTEAVIRCTTELSRILTEYYK